MSAHVNRSSRHGSYGIGGGCSVPCSAGTGRTHRRCGCSFVYGSNGAGEHRVGFNNIRSGVIVRIGITFAQLYLRIRHRNNVFHIGVEQCYLSHLAVHVAGNNGQRVGILVNTAHDAHGLHGQSVGHSGGLRLSSGGYHAGGKGVRAGHGGHGAGCSGVSAVHRLFGGLLRLRVNGLGGKHSVLRAGGGCGILCAGAVVSTGGCIQRRNAGVLKLCAVFKLCIHAEQVVQIRLCTVGAAVHSHGAGDVLIINNDVAGLGGAAVLFQQPVHAAHGAAQGKYAGLLRDGALGNLGVLQAVGKEHHVPLAVGIAIGLTVAGVVAQGHAVRRVDLEVFLALLVAQLGLCHAEQILVPLAGDHGIGVGGLPLLGGLKVGRGIAQAAYGVVMLRQGAHQHFLVAGVGVVVVDGLHSVHHRLQRHRLCHRHGHQLGALGGLYHLLHKLALFQAAGQLVLGGVAAFIVGMLKFFTDQGAVLGVVAVIIVDVLFLHAGQGLHFGVAVIGVLVGHKLDLRLQLQRHDLFLGAALGSTGGGSFGSGNFVRIFKLAFRVAADQHLVVAIRRVGVLHLAALVLRGHRDANAVQLPVDEQGGDHGKRQHKCGVAPQRVPVFAELLLVGFKDVVHNLEYLLPGSMDQRETGQGPYP